MKVNYMCRIIFILSAALLSAALLSAVSCGKEPIFYTIAKETAPIPPLIEGAPTNMVVFEHEFDEKLIPLVYTASGRLHWYASSRADGTRASWDLEKYTISQPSGKIIALATTKKFMYALCLNGYGVDATLWRISHTGNSWQKVGSDVSEYPLLQSIYADPETNLLFAGAGINEKNQASYAILYLDDTKNSNRMQLLRDKTAMFSGSVSKGTTEGDHTIYLSTKGNGIFRVNEADFSGGDAVTVRKLTDNSTDKLNNRVFMGIIKLQNKDQTIIAIERDGGALYEIENNTFKQILYEGGSRNGEVMATGRYSTGAMTPWKTPQDSLMRSGARLLIVGIQGGLYNSVATSYTHGYVEFELTSTGSLNRSRPRLDPGSLQSIIDNDRYKATIGKHPINHMFQVPENIDKNTTFFASTQTAGLWSYKDRPDSGGWQWNAEQ